MRVFFNRLLKRTQRVRHAVHGGLRPAQLVGISWLIGIERDGALKLRNRQTIPLIGMRRLLAEFEEKFPASLVILGIVAVNANRLVIPRERGQRLMQILERFARAVIARRQRLPEMKGEHQHNRGANRQKAPASAELAGCEVFRRTHDFARARLPVSPRFADFFPAGLREIGGGGRERGDDKKQDRICRNLHVEINETVREDGDAAA